MAACGPLSLTEALFLFRQWARTGRHPRRRRREYVTVHQLSRLDARCIAVRAQQLDKARPTGLLDVVRHLTMLQLDPTDAVRRAPTSWSGAASARRTRRPNWTPRWRTTRCSNSRR
jgi:hypothetical protein